MKLMELYNSISNPIEDINVVEKIIDIYAKSNSINTFGNYYASLVRMTEKEYKGGEYTISDFDYFYAMMFNKWKNNVVAMTREEFEELYRKGSYGIDFIKMRNYLKQVKDVSTFKEVGEIVFGDYDDVELSNAFEKYKWDALGEDSSWVHVCSKYVTAMHDEYPNIEHRLYLNTETVDMHKMCSYLVEKCDKYQLPYYFKFPRYSYRDDTIVIYSSTENLNKYLEILNEIKKEHPELVSNFKKPPLLTGNIDGWIGYGSEPERTPDGKAHSFNEIRTNNIIGVLDMVTKDWILDHINKRIRYNGQVISFLDYVSLKATNDIIKRLESDYNFNKDYEISRGKKFDSNAFYLKYGYTLDDIKSSDFKDKVYAVINSYVKNNLSVVCNGSYKELESVKIDLNNNQYITFNGRSLEDIIHKLSFDIYKMDSNFSKTIQTEIANNSKKFGIDSNNFCFDLSAIERFKEVDSKMVVVDNKIDDNSVVINTTTAIVEEKKKIQKEKLKDEVTEQSNNIVSTKINVHNIDVDLTAFNDYLQSAEGLKFLESVTASIALDSTSKLK